MNNNQHNDNIEKNVFEKIRSGEVKMHSKTYFVFKIMALVLVALLVLATSAVLVSFMLFSLRVSGRLFLLGFGVRGFEAFFLTFPWFILLADILFIVFFERLLNHFKIGYRSPLLYTLGTSALLIIIFGFVLDHISFHEALAQEALEHRLGPVGMIYQGIRLPPHSEGVFRGIVATGTPATTTAFINSFSMRRDDEDPDTDDATDTPLLWRVILPPGVSIAGFLAPGDVVIVAGDISSDTIRAYGIRKIAAGDEQ